MTTVSIGLPNGLLGAAPQQPVPRTGNPGVVSITPAVELSTVPVPNTGAALTGAATGAATIMAGAQAPGMIAGPGLMVAPGVVVPGAPTTISGITAPAGAARPAPADPQIIAALVALISTLQRLIAAQAANPVVTGGGHQAATLPPPPMGASLIASPAPLPGPAPAPALPVVHGSLPPQSPQQMPASPKPHV